MVYRHIWILQCSAMQDHKPVKGSLSYTCIFCTHGSQCKLQNWHCHVQFCLTAISQGYAETFVVFHETLFDFARFLFLLSSVCVCHSVCATPYAPEQVKEEDSTGAAVSFDIPWQSLTVVELVYSSLPEWLRLLQRHWDFSIHHRK